MSTDAKDSPAGDSKVSKKQQKKEDKKQKKGGGEIDHTTLPADTLKVFLSENEDENLKVKLIAAWLKVTYVPIPYSNKGPFFPQRPAIIHKDVQLFGATSVVRYFLLQKELEVTENSLSLLNEERFILSPAAQGTSSSSITPELVNATLERVLSSLSSSLSWEHLLLYTSLKKLAPQHAIVSAVESSEVFKEVQREKEGGAREAESLSSLSVSLPAVSVSSVSLDSSLGLMNSLRTLFSLALASAFVGLEENEETRALLSPSLSKCAQPRHGDFQINNALSLAKYFKTSPSVYKALSQPRLVAERIVSALPSSPIVQSVSVAPNGFINIALSSQTLTQTIAELVQHGVQPPKVDRLKVLVDFSSPNIAKEMHVGHLRSTILGDALCRVLEFCGHDVMRINHVGDWGTQFGMLLGYLHEVHPDFGSEEKESDPELDSIGYLTTLYKASKQRFDADPVFQEKARRLVVSLQSGDKDCRRMWTKLCDLSRREFQRVYDLLDVSLKEMGESFYNPFIPAVIEELTAKGMVTVDQGMDIVRLADYSIPLILRKSDGGYGYDSTDMAAVQYRLQTLQRDWVIVITDAGQNLHFQLVYEAARQAGWVTHQRLDHIGFGVVCGEDGKRFKTRSSETVKLLDLLLTATEKMGESLRERQRLQEELAQQAAAEKETEEAQLAAKKMKPALASAEEISKAAHRLGIGAVKYFDLKQHPATNYIFSYDAMLNTKGDTAVYLMFAYARFCSILRKAEEERGHSLSALKSQALTSIRLEAPEERALAFALLQIGDVLSQCLRDLLPHRLCDYLQEVCVKGTEFVTQCSVLQAPSQDLVHSRLLLCEATRLVMQRVFNLLGIEPCDRI